MASTPEVARASGPATATPQDPSPPATAPRRQNGGAASGTNPEGANVALTTRSSQVPSYARPHRLRTLRSYRAGPLTFVRLEQREGVVLEVGREGDMFRARLVDPAGKAPDEEVDIEMAQVSIGDLGLVAEGALFFWVVGYLVKVSGNRQLVLRVDFRRLPPADRCYKKRAEDAAQRYMEDMNWT